jgi:hypothetical protein
MRSKFVVPVCVALVGLAAGAYAQMSHSNHHDPKVMLTWGGMYGVDGGLLGATHAIRGVVGDDSPWEVAKSAKGSLSTAGQLSITVRGLVFKDDPSVPVELRGKNDETDFRALVSCMTEDSDTPVNVVTEGFKADANGNSNIKAKLTLPNPCVAPIVFVLAGSSDVWFAVTGVELASPGGS